MHLYNDASFNPSITYNPLSEVTSLVNYKVFIYIKKLSIHLGLLESPSLHSSTLTPELLELKILRPMISQ